MAAMGSSRSFSIIESKKVIGRPSQPPLPPPHACMAVRVSVWHNPPLRERMACHKPETKLRRTNVKHVEVEASAGDLIRIVGITELNLLLLGQSVSLSSSKTQAAARREHKAPTDGHRSHVGQNHAVRCPGKQFSRYQ